MTDDVLDELANEPLSAGDSAGGRRARFARAGRPALRQLATLIEHAASQRAS